MRIKHYCQQLYHACLSACGLMRKPRTISAFKSLSTELHEVGIISSAQMVRISKILDLRHIRVSDVMVARSIMSVISVDQSIAEIKKLIKDSGHSRFPALDEAHRKVIGLVFAKDLLIQDRKTTIKNLLRPAFFIPESKRLDNLLSEFQHKHQHMAIVVDEYGDYAGLITIEDIIEQITGDIEDEHDIQDDGRSIRKLEGGKFLVQANVALEEFNAYFTTDIDDSICDTIGGVVLHNLGYIPQKGDALQLGKLAIQIHTASPKQILWLMITIQTD